MKFVCEKAHLLQGISMVQNVVSTKSPIPILSNILIETNHENIHFSATDLEVGVKCTIPAEIKKEGTITIPAKRFADIAKELPDGKTIFITDEKNLLTISAENLTYQIFGLPKEDFPVTPELQKTKTFNISAACLKEAISKTIFAVSKDIIKLYLNGGNVKIQEKKLKIATTDGHRLAYMEKEIDEKFPEPISFIAPTKALHELENILQSEDGNVQMSFTENMFAVKTKRATLTARLLEGQYPDYEKIIFTEQPKKLSLSSDTLFKAIKRVSVLSADKNNPVKLAFSKNKIKITAQIPEIGEAKDELQVDYNGEQAILTCNATYMIDALRNFDGKNIDITFNDDTTPIRLNIPDKIDYVSVVMPMRV